MNFECDACGFDDNLTPDSITRAHMIVHCEWEHGVHLPRVDSFECIGQVQGLRVLLVRPSSPKFMRIRAERLSRRSIREPLGEGGYDKPLYFASARDSPPELCSHAILLARGAFAVGIVVLERRPVIDLYEWTERPRFRLLCKLSDTVRWSVIHVWLLPQLRGQGVASELAHVAIEGVGETPDTVGWLSPYSKRGIGLMARVTKEGFHRASRELPIEGLVSRPFSNVASQSGRMERA